MHTLFCLENRSILHLEGANVPSLLKLLLCGDVRSLKENHVLFSPMLNLQGGTMDTVIVFSPREDECWMIVHECSREKILRHIQKQSAADVRTEDCRGRLHLYALMGREAESLLESAPVFFSICTDHMGETCHFACVEEESITAFETHMAQRGVTLHSQSDLDVMMIENGIAVYGRELDDTINPLEAGLGQYVRLERTGFIGREALVAAGEPRRGVIGLEVERYGARHGLNVVHRDKDVGVVTSACYSAKLQKHIALALVEKPYQDLGRRLKVEYGDELITAYVAQLPFQAGESEEDAEETQNIPQ